MSAEARKLVVQVAARGGVDAKLEPELAGVADWLRARLGSGGAVALLVRVADDPFASANPGMRGFDATLDLRSAAPEPAPRLIGAIEGLGERLAGIAHVDLSAALVGTDQRIVPCPADPVRYQYAMRRRADLTRAQYFAHYLQVHAEFGRRQPGVLGYTQFHVDAELSRRAAQAAGVGIWAFDSISELHLDALRTFTDALARMSAEAINGPLLDEENFVDRANSVSFVTRLVGS
jgi:hypothetical protein